MSIRKQYSLHPNNQHRDPESACTHCEGIVRHELWCATQSAIVQYAMTAFLDPDQLSIEDELILHGLGVTWKAEAPKNKKHRLK